MNTFIFSDTGAAYDACQCDDRLKDGDVLVVSDEGVVGICGTWPMAITVASGKLHALNPAATAPVIADALGMSVDALLTRLRAAVATAEHMGAEICPATAALLAA